MNMTCSLGSMPSSAILSMRAFRLALRPRTLLMGTSLPSSEVCMTGLMESMEPKNAAPALRRPPIFR